MGIAAPDKGNSLAAQKPPAFLKSKRERDVWKYIVSVLAQSGRDYRSALVHIGLLVQKIHIWREYVDLIEASAGIRYEHDKNGGSLEQVWSMAERRARAQVVKSLCKSALTVMSARRIKALDRAVNNDLFDADPFEAAASLEDGHIKPPEAPPWKLTKYERKLWRTFLLPLVMDSGLDFSTAGISLGVLAAGFEDLHCAQEWLTDNRCAGFVRSKEGGNEYEVSASTNRWKVFGQIERLLERNGMTVEACAKYKTLSGESPVTDELLELLRFINERPD